MTRSTKVILGILAAFVAIVLLSMLAADFGGPESDTATPPATDAPAGSAPEPQTPPSSSPTPP